MNQSNNHPGIIACDGSFFTLSPKKIKIQTEQRNVLQLVPTHLIKHKKNRHIFPLFLQSESHIYIYTKPYSLSSGNAL